MKVETKHYYSHHTKKSSEFFGQFIKKKKQKKQKKNLSESPCSPLGDFLNILPDDPNLL